MKTIVDCYLPFAKKKLGKYLQISSAICFQQYTTGCLSCIFLLFEVFDCSNGSDKQSRLFVCSAFKWIFSRFCWFSPFSSLKTTLTPFDTYSHTNVSSKSRKTTITYALFTSYISFVFDDVSIIMRAVIFMPPKTFL